MQKIDRFIERRNRKQGFLSIYDRKFEREVARIVLPNYEGTVGSILEIIDNYATEMEDEDGVFKDVGN